MSKQEELPASIERLVVKKGLRNIAIDSIQRDPSYQREVKRKHKDIVTDFVEEALGIPIVGEREDGSLWIIDGLQRITALFKLGNKKVTVLVVASKGPEHEALIFRKINGGRAGLTPQEMFQSALTAQEPAAWRIKECVESCGLRLNLKKGGTTSEIAVSCVTTLVACERVYGCEAIKFALEVARDSWPGDKKAFYGQIISGMCGFYKKHEGMIDMDRFDPRIKSVTPHKIIYQAQNLALTTGASSSSGAISSSVMQVIEKIYKKRMAPRPR